ncbi:amidohydrolase family protein [Nocardiopsis flavescens]|uniref:imidazolonepropionase n=1 Tax=Nocardiopsis flavescens TaxID=758803 RepID=A0A1M6EAW1_9ACTN|nr:amidohydrolase family protein [Nocardiopsis flavescens]SHI82509.1 imidazolonepropionase [Nocardiopsis flavescens]
MAVVLLSNIGRLWTGNEMLTKAALLIDDERVAWVGPAAELPQRLPGVYEDLTDVDDIINIGGGLITPGLVDAHCHPVYAGDRYAEVSMWAKGASQGDIFAAGGGVSTTVTITRGTDPWTLCNAVRERLRHWVITGTTTVEAKTGYHLTRDGELADVRLLRSLEEEPGMPRLHITFFPAHGVPPEFFGRPAEYVATAASWLADAAQVGADGVDVYCDNRQFTTDDARMLLSVGQSVGLRTTLHACSRPRHGAVRMAAELGCTSVDLLHETDDDDILALAATRTPVVACPTTSMHERRHPPVRSLLDHGVPVGLGTDHNPGQSGATSMPLIISLAVAMFQMTVQEALHAATVGGARALGLADRGMLTPGNLADLVQWDADHEGAFAWSMGLKALHVWQGGRTIH